MFEIIVHTVPYTLFHFVDESGIELAGSPGVHSRGYFPCVWSVKWTVLKSRGSNGALQGFVYLKKNDRKRANGIGLGLLTIQFVESSIPNLSKCIRELEQR